MPETQSLYFQIILEQLAEHIRENKADASLLHNYVRDDFESKPHRNLIRDKFYREIITNPDDATLLLEVFHYYDNASTDCSLIRLFDFSTREMILAHNGKHLATQFGVQPISKQDFTRLEEHYQLKFDNGLPRLQW